MVNEGEGAAHPNSARRADMVSHTPLPGKVQELRDQVREFQGEVRHEVRELREQVQEFRDEIRDIVLPHPDWLLP
jgi:uncharacterized coiled-coil DUF342 family protein